MSALLRFIPGSTIRWRAHRFVIVDYAGMDAILAREVGKRRLQRVPLNEAVVDHASGELNAFTPDLVSVRENAWQTAVKRFKIPKPLLEGGRAKGSFAEINEIARRLGKHPSTIYRWIDDYARSGRLSVFLRKERSDRGRSRLPDKVNALIDAAINKMYLKAEQPDVAAVIEEVHRQCFKINVKKPHPVTVRRRVAALPDRLKLEKRNASEAAHGCNPREVRIPVLASMPAWWRVGTNTISARAYFHPDD